MLWPARGWPEGLYDILGLSPFVELGKTTQTVSHPAYAARWLPWDNPCSLVLQRGLAVWKWSQHDQAALAKYLGCQSWDGVCVHGLA